MSTSDRREAWHWLKADFTAGSGTEPAWAIGEERVIKGSRKLVLCERGYHSSPTPFGGLEYAPGPLLCRVEIEGIAGGDETKNVSRIRKLLDVRNVEKELRLFAADCAERALLREREHGREPDRRSWSPIEAARSFVNGLITPEELAAAWAAARDAAWDPAWDAARDAARAAAWAAARDAARDAERAWQREHFNEIMLTVFAVAS